MTDEELRSIERECRQMQHVVASTVNQGAVAFYGIRRLAEFIGALALHIRKEGAK